MATVLFSGAWPGSAAARLAAEHEVVLAPEGIARAAGVIPWGNLEAICPMVHEPVDEALLDRCPRLRVVAVIAVGFDRVDVAACRRRGVLVTHTPDVLTEATADLTFALLLSVARRVVEGDRLVREGAFPAWSPTTLLGAQVHGATLGVVGFGRIGRAVARRAGGFSMRVLAAHPTPIEAGAGVEQCSLDSLLERSDFVSLHAPLREGTRGLIGREQLRRMKRGAFLINTARGALVDEEELVRALSERHLGGAGLDVFAHEPLVPESLARSPHVVLTPHIGSADADARAKMAALAVDNVLAVLRGDAPRTPVAP